MPMRAWVIFDYVQGVGHVVSGLDLGSVSFRAYSNLPDSSSRITSHFLLRCHVWRLLRDELVVFWQDCCDSDSYILHDFGLAAEIVQSSALLETALQQM